ncbi:MAG: hypothetical protein HY791_14840 [Deltaproteobacteria bacterium]|nr:hypothetical protein [Deltaproteobacteria bacterium]
MIEEVRFHRTEGYRDAANVLSERLAVGDGFVVHARGSWYVTAFREKNYRGPIRAYTTRSPLRLSDGVGYGLAIFDEQFRLTQNQEMLEVGPNDVVLDPSDRVRTSTTR